MSLEIHKSTENLTKEAKKLQLAFVKQMLSLATSAFGLVAALAWNNVIREFVDYYIKPYLPQGSGILSLLIYAIIITVLAVLVTFNLSRISEKLEEKVEDKKK